FMAAVLSADMQHTDKVVINIKESREMGLTILPPDINRGEYRFVADGDDAIIYGLGAIKGLGEGAIESIVQSRKQDGRFSDLYDLCERVDSRKLNKRGIEALIGCGALDQLVTCGEDSIDYKRALLAAHQDDAVRMAEQKARNVDSGHGDLFGDDMMLSGSADSDSRYNHFENLRSLTFRDRLHREKETLGLYLTGHPLDMYSAELEHLAKTRIIDLRVGKDEQTVVGLIVSMRTMKSRRGETLAFVTLDDRTDRIEVAVFAELYNTHYEKLQKDQVVVVKGSTSVDDFTGGIKMQATEVYNLIEARGRSVRRLTLSLESEALRDDFTGELASLLMPYKGANGQGCPVSIDYCRADARAQVVLGDEWRVLPEDELIQSLRDHYGNDHVRLDYT
ncbi:MAG: DNA polymerase III subunit alpha, partial [Pseudomonadales bacterium]|nr:DNA polymerase III subunit alpha [Pseudomonadales bacterium]